ncbi:hypothetical protein IFM47457_04933 [Aspergillus lentulus]|nr:hypothetical protein IFM47457_04933 [Aspergillus lentulus]
MLESSGIHTLTSPGTYSAIVRFGVESSKILALLLVFCVDDSGRRTGCKARELRSQQTTDENML